MNTMPENPRVTIGGNNPPVVTPPANPEVIIADLAHRHGDISTRYDELMASAATIPDVIDNDVDSGKLGDLVKEIRLWDKRADGARSIEKEPYLKGGQAVDAYFKNMIDEMKKKSKLALDVNGAYLIKKKQEETRRLEAEAKAKREESERLARESALVEERRVALEEANREAEAKAAEARDNKDELEQRKLNADAALATAKAKRAKARRDKDDTALAIADGEIAACETELTAAKTELREARAAIAEADRQQRLAASQERTAARETTALFDDAVRAGGQADKIDRRLSTASDGDLVRNRGQHGSVNTLARRWVATIKDRKLVEQNIAMLLPFIDIDTLAVAVNKRMMTQNRDVPGVHYEEVSEARAI